jgi:hypothetical protein
MRCRRTPKPTPRAAPRAAATALAPPGAGQLDGVLFGLNVAERAIRHPGAQAWINRSQKALPVPGSSSASGVAVGRASVVQVDRSELQAAVAATTVSGSLGAPPRPQRESTISTEKMAALAAESDDDQVPPPALPRVARLLPTLTARPARVPVGLDTRHQPTDREPVGYEPRFSVV